MRPPSVFMVKSSSVARWSFTWTVPRASDISRPLYVSRSTVASSVRSSMGGTGITSSSGSSDLHSSRSKCRLPTVALPRSSSPRRTKPSRLSIQPVAWTSLLPSCASRDWSSARRGERASVASCTATGCRRPAALTVTFRADAVPLALTRSQRALSTSDMRARTAASAVTTPLSSSTDASLTVRPTSARSRVPWTRASTSGSETGVRSVIEASTGWSPIATWKRCRRTTVLSTSPPGLSTERSRAMSRAGRGRSG